ncbi:MAG: hypothetical protein U1D67_09125, partial [Dehalococcoidia bacterium]|nr:hypothetical protein [Dehalococcoidia bacterium]
FNLPLIFEEVLKKRFAIAGFAAFITLLPLVITSTRGWAKRLGGDWQRLHKLVYLTALLAVTHFTWQVKADFRLPLLYGIIIIFLLVIRLPQVRAKLDELTLPLRNLISAIGRHK